MGNANRLMCTHTHTDRGNANTDVYLYVHTNLDIHVCDLLWEKVHFHAIINSAQCAVLRYFGKTVFLLPTLV